MHRWRHGQQLCRRALGAHIGRVFAQLFVLLLQLHHLLLQPQHGAPFLLQQPLGCRLLSGVNLGFALQCRGRLFQPRLLEVVNHGGQLSGRQPHTTSSNNAQRQWRVTPPAAHGGDQEGSAIAMATRPGIAVEQVVTTRDGATRSSISPPCKGRDEAASSALSEGAGKRDTGPAHCQLHMAFEQPKTRTSCTLCLSVSTCTRMVSLLGVQRAHSKRRRTMSAAPVWPT